MPCLTSLPAELFILISSFLGPGQTDPIDEEKHWLYPDFIPDPESTTNDFGAFRLTCRYIAAFLFETFGRRYFSFRVFVRTEPSLQRLVDIAKSRFSPYLKEIAIGSGDRPDLYITHDGLDIHRSIVNIYTSGIDNNPSSVERLLGAAREDHRRANHNFFLATALDQLMLIEAFENLMNLEKITLLACASSRGVWESGGNDRAADRKLNAGCIQNVLCALARSGAKPKALVINFGAQMLEDDAFNLPTYMESRISPVLANLEVLNIVQFSPLQEVVVCSEEGKLQRICTHYLRKFLLRVSQVKHLRFTEVYGTEDTFFDWLSGPVSIKPYEGPRGLEPLISPTFPRLYELTFFACIISPKALVALIQKCSATLRHLKIWGTTLNMFARSDLPDFLAHLAHIGRRLDVVSFTEVSVMIFEEDDNNYRSWDDVINLYYAGRDMEDTLRGLIDVVRLEGEGEL